MRCWAQHFFYPPSGTYLCQDLPLLPVSVCYCLLQHNQDPQQILKHSLNTRASCFNSLSCSIWWFRDPFVCVFGALQARCTPFPRLTCSNSSRSTSPSPFRSNILKAISKFLWGAGHKNKFKDQYHTAWKHVALDRPRQRARNWKAESAITWKHIAF